MVLPEEVPGSVDAVMAAREVWTRMELDEGNRKLRWYGGGMLIFTLFTFYQNWLLIARRARQAGTDFSWTDPAVLTLGSVQLGLALLLFVIFALIPWYSAYKRRKELRLWTEEKISSTVPSIRFETWLERQKAPVTYVMLGLIAIVYLIQLLPGDDLRAAALYHDLANERWRLLTAPFLHGNIVHLLMNGSAMLYLGKRMEVFARWPHVPMVFLVAAYIGGETSLQFLTDKPAVGASGGLMGWLGFLLVFETLHSRLVPRHARRRLVAGILLTAFIGLVGYRYIDNAAHAGGLIAGMAYAAIVFPKSASAIRPKATITDRICGSLALLALIGCAVLAIIKLRGH